MSYTQDHLDETVAILQRLDVAAIEKTIDVLVRLKASGGRIFFLGVGGSVEKNISRNLVAAVDHARKRGARIIGIVGRDGGYTARVADACVIIPTVNPRTVTPHCEALQAAIWHLLVSHPRLGPREGKWESTE